MPKLSLSISRFSQLSAEELAKYAAAGFDLHITENEPAAARVAASVADLDNADLDDNAPVPDDTAPAPVTAAAAETAPADELAALRARLAVLEGKPAAASTALPPAEEARQQRVKARIAKALREDNGQTAIGKPGGWNRNAARVFMRDNQGEFEKHFADDNGGRLPQHRHSGFPVTLIDGQLVCVERGQVVTRNDLA